MHVRSNFLRGNANDEETSVQALCKHEHLYRIPYLNHPTMNSLPPTNELEEYLRDATPMQRKSLADLGITTLAKLVQAAAEFARPRARTAQEDVVADRVGHVVYIRHVTGFLQEYAHNAFVNKWRAIQDGLIVEGGVKPFGWWGVPVTPIASGLPTRETPQNKQPMVISSNTIFDTSPVASLFPPISARSQPKPSFQKSHVEVPLYKYLEDHICNGTNAADLLKEVYDLVLENTTLSTATRSPAPIGKQRMAPHHGWSPFDSPIAIHGAC